MGWVIDSTPRQYLDSTAHQIMGEMLYSRAYRSESARSGFHTAQGLDIPPRTNTDGR